MISFCLVVNTKICKLVSTETVSLSLVSVVLTGFMELWLYISQVLTEDLFSSTQINLPQHMTLCRSH